MKGNQYFNYILLVLFLAVSIGCSKDLTDAEYYKNAQEHYQKGEIDAAIIQLKNALQKNASNLKARELLGMIYADLGFGAVAEKELRRAIILGADETKLDMYLAESLFQQKKYQDVFDDFSKTSGLDAKTISEHNIILTRASLALRKPEEAKRYFAKISDSDKETVPGLYVSIDMSLLSHDLTNAKKLVEKIISEKPDEVRAWMIKGMISYDEGNLLEAETNYKEALQHYKSRQASSLMLQASTGLFYAELKQKKYNEALETSKKLLSMAKNSPQPKYLRGLLAFEQKDFDTAQNYLEEVYSIVPNHIPTVMLLGSINYFKKNYEQANNYLSFVISENPENIQARKLLAATRMHLYKSEDALKILDPVVSKKTTDSQLLSMVAAAAIQSGKIDVGESYLRRAQKSNPDNPSIRTELAKVYMQKGEYDEAISELDKIKSDDTDSTNILKIMTYVQKKDFASARKLAQEVNQRRDDERSLSLLGGVERAAGNSDKARIYFSRALKKNPDFTPALLNLGKLELQEDKVTAAKNDFNKVLNKQPSNVAALLGLAQISEKEGDNKSALNYIKIASDKNSKAILPRILLARYYIKERKLPSALQYAKEAYNIAPKDAGLAISLANIYIVNQDILSALGVLEDLKQQQPDNPTVALEIARAYIKDERTDDAKSELRRAISLKPDFYIAQITLARLQIADGEYDKAIKEAKILQKRYPLAAMGYLLEGDVYSAQKAYLKAEGMYQKATKIKASPLTYMKSAEAQVLHKNSDKAIAELQAGIKAFPNATILQMQVATLYQAVGHLDEAQTTYETLVNKYPENIAVLNNLALIYLDKKDNRAVKLAEAAHNLDPENQAVADTLGWIYVQLGHTNKGTPLLKAAADKTGNPSIQYHYAVALSVIKNDAAAIMMLKKALASAHNFVERKDAEALLEKLNKK